MSERRNFSTGRELTAACSGTKYLSGCNFGPHDVPFDHLTFNIKGTEIRAVFYEHHGAADVLKVGERRTSRPQNHEVPVEVVATSINPIDRRLRGGELQEYITRNFR